MMSFDVQDPTLTNLRRPFGGGMNLLSLPGALVGGTLIEFLGFSGLFLPLLLLNWVFATRKRMKPTPYIIFSLASIISGATLHGIALSGENAVQGGAALLGLTSPGLVGFAGANWVKVSSGYSLGWIILSPFLLFSLWQIVHIPALKAAVRDLKLFAMYLGPQTVVFLRNKIRQGKNKLWQIAVRFPGPFRKKAVTSVEQDFSAEGTWRIHHREETATKKDGFDSWFSSDDSENK